MSQTKEYDDAALLAAAEFYAQEPDGQHDQLAAHVLRKHGALVRAVLAAWKTIPKGGCLCGRSESCEVCSRTPAQYAMADAVEAAVKALGITP